jgi:hypothetical protein
MFKRFFTQDTPLVGLVAGLGSILATAALITVAMLIAGDTSTHLSLYAGCFVPPLLIMRYYVKQQHITVVKTIIVSLFITFIAFMFLLFKTHSLNLNP